MHVRSSLGVKGVLGVAVAASLLLAGACSIKGSPAQEPGVVGKTPFASSACGECVAQACIEPIRLCRADESCNAHLHCIEVCPIGALGDADAACEAACPTAAGYDAVLLERRVAHCRSEGPGAECGACHRPLPGGGDAAAAVPADAASKPKNPILDQICAPSPAADLCAKCEENLCCTTRAACADNAECRTLATCTSACAGDEARAACETACFRGVSAPVLKLHAARFACVQVYCSTPTTCGTTAVPACQSCALTRCKNEFVDCYGEPACRAAAGCADRCKGEAACIDTCLREVPAAVRQAYFDFTTCGLLRCPTECQPTR